MQTAAVIPQQSTKEQDLSRRYYAWKHRARTALMFLSAALVIGLATFALASVMLEKWSLASFAAADGLAATAALYLLNRLRSIR